MKRARGAHIVIRGLGWKQRERIVDQKWLRVGLCTAGAFRRATTCHGWHTQFARSLASRPFAREFYLYHHVPGRPASRRSFARSLVYLRSVVVSVSSVPGPGVFGGVPSSTEKALGISLRAEP